MSVLPSLTTEQLFECALRSGQRVAETEWTACGYIVPRVLLIDASNGDTRVFRGSELRDLEEAALEELRPGEIVTLVHMGELHHEGRAPTAIVVVSVHLPRKVRTRFAHAIGKELAWRDAPTELSRSIIAHVAN